MIELSQLLQDYDENKAEQVEKYRSLTQKQSLYVYMTLGVSIFIISMVTFINFLEKRGYTAAERKNNNKWFSITTAVFYFTMSILISIRLYYIMKTIHKHFGNEFERETFWLRLSLNIFVVMFVFRCLLTVLEVFELWPNPFFDNDFGLWSSLAYVF